MRGKNAKTQRNEKDGSFSSSSVPRSFFKVMYGNFKESLKIPPCFAPHVTQMAGKQISLKTYIRTFKCKMERDKDGKCFIKRGWSSLLRAHSIYEGCFLTFKMKSDASFSVRIYGQSALEWGSVGTVETGTSTGTGLVGDEARERWKYEEGTPSKGHSCKRGRKSRTTSNLGSSESNSTDEEQNESEYNEKEQTTSEDSSYEEKEREKVQEKERQMRRVKRERRKDEAGTSSKGRRSKRVRTISKSSRSKSNYKNEEEKCGSDFRNEEELELHEEKIEIECLNLDQNLPDEELHEKESGFDSLDGDSSKEREEEEEEKDKELEATDFEEEKGKKSEVANEKEAQKSNYQTATSEEPRRSMLLYKKDIPKFFGHLFVKYLHNTVLDKPNCSTVETCRSKRQSGTSLVPNEAQQSKRLKMDEKESGSASSSSEGDTCMDHHESNSADQEENTSEKLEEELEEEVDCESMEENKCERAEIGCEKEKEIGEEECQIEEIESLDGDKSERSADFESMEKEFEEEEEEEEADFESMEKESEEKIADFKTERANFESMEKELEEKEERADFASIEKYQCERAEYGCEKEKEVAEEECEIEEFESLNGDKYERAHIEIQEGEKEGEFDNFELMDGDQCKISEIESEERNEEGEEEIQELVSESEDELKKNDKESENELMEKEKENEDELTENEKEIGHELEENEKEIGDELVENENEIGYELTESEKEIRDELMENEKATKDELEGNEKEIEDELVKKEKEIGDELMENEKEIEDELTGNEKEIEDKLMENEKETEEMDSPVNFTERGESLEKDEESLEPSVIKTMDDLQSEIGLKESEKEKSLNSALYCENLEKEQEELNPSKDMIDLESETEKEEEKRLISPVREKQALDPFKHVNNSESEFNPKELNNFSEPEFQKGEKEMDKRSETEIKCFIISDSDEERETDTNEKKEIIEEITQDVKEKETETSVYPVNFSVSCENLERENEELNPFKQVNDLDYESETEKEEEKTLISPVREKEILEPTEKPVNNSDSELNPNESNGLAELELKNREKGKGIKCFIISDSDRERESDAIEKKEIIEEITQDVNSESSDEIDWKQLESETETETETETEIENESNLGFQNVNSESSDEIDREQFKAEVETEIESESNLVFQNETRVVRYESGEIRSENISNSEDCEEHFHISYRNPSLENRQLFLESSDDEEGCNSEDLSEKEEDKTLNTIGIDMINEGNSLESGEDQSGNCDNEPGANLEFPPENQDLKVVAIQGDKFETGNDAFDGINLEIASENQDPFESGVNLKIPSQNHDPVRETECENQEIEKSQVTVSTCTGEDLCDSGANLEIPPENKDQETKGMFCNTSIITDRDKQESGKDISAENQDIEKEGTTCVDLVNKGYTCEQRANMEIPDETQEKETEVSDCVDTTKNGDECEPGAESVISSEIQGFEIPSVTGNDVSDASSLKISYEDQNPESSEFMKDVNVNLLEPGANMEIYAELQDLEAGNDLACGKNSDIPFEDQDINQPQITVSTCNVDGENVLCDSGAKPEIPLQNQDNMDIVNDGDKHESGNDILKIPTEDQNPERTEFMISINAIQDIGQLGPGANMEIHAEHHDPTLGNEISSEYQNIEQAQVTDSTYIFKGEDIFDAGVNLEIISENHDHETEGLVCNMDITTDRDIHDTGKYVLAENQGLELEAIPFMDLLNNEDASEQSANSEIPAENQDENNYELVTKRMAGINLNIPSKNQDAEPINKVYNYMDLIKSVEACEPVANPVIMFENQDESGAKSVILSEKQGLELALVSTGEEENFESGGNNQELLLIENKGHESQQEVCLDIVAQEDPNSEAPISIVRPYESGKLHIVPVQEERPLVVARPEIQENYVLLPNPFNITFSIQSNNSEWIKLPNKLPNSVHKKKGGKKIVSLRDSCMREWPALYTETKSFIGFTFGWDRFAKANKIAEGDICRLYEVGCEFGDHYQVDIQKTLLSYQTSRPILYTRRKEAK